MKFQYFTEGTCSRCLDFEIDNNGILHGLRFTGGCPGNTLGLAALAEGCNARELVARLKGTRCRDKNTSCPDQLAIALEKALQQLESVE